MRHFDTKVDGLVDGFDGFLMVWKKIEFEKSVSFAGGNNMGNSRSI